MESEVAASPVKSLHYALDLVPGSEIFQGARCYLTSKKLAETLQATGLSGAQFASALVTASPILLELHPDARVGEYRWLKVTGALKADDFSLDKYSRLVVSDAALTVLRQANMEGCEIFDYEAAPTPEEQMARLFGEPEEQNRKH